MNPCLLIVPDAPFRLDLTVWALRRTPGNRIDAWDGRRWQRSLLIGDAWVSIEVEQTGPVDMPVLAVRCIGVDLDDAAQVRTLECLLRATLGIDRSMDGFAHRAARDALLAPLAARFRGLRPPRFPDLFEALANAVACQQVSLASGLSLLSKTATRLAPPSLHPNAPPPFPRPRDVLDAGIPVLRNLGWSQRKADYLLGCAKALADGELNVAELEAAPDAQAQQILSRLRGIKRWSAQYVALRGLGRLAVLPVDDVGAHKHLALWLGTPRLDADAMQELARRWQPDAGMVYFMLLLKRLDDQGLLSTPRADSPTRPPWGVKETWGGPALP